MGIVKQIKISIGEYFLFKELKKIKRNKEILSFEQIKTIGVIYEFSEEWTYNTICDIVKKLNTDNKTVKALGLYDKKKLPEYCHTKISHDFCVSNDFNFYYKPVGEVVKHFINTDFDLIINLSIKNTLTSNYIVGLSEAKYKVGLYNDNNVAIYDLMIKLSDEISILELYKQVMHYLKIFNK